jgi:hypothetical protein
MTEGRNHWECGRRSWSSVCESFDNTAVGPEVACTRCQSSYLDAVQCSAEGVNEDAGLFACCGGSCILDAGSTFGVCPMLAL